MVDASASPVARDDTNSPSAPVIAVERLTRAFGSRLAVDSACFDLRHGECLAVFGPNGAGKTTLLRLVAGLLAPTAGSCTVNGVDVREGPGARSRIGMISHASMLYGQLSARENVEFSARLYGLRDPRGEARHALAAMRVLDRAETPVRALSRGLQQRVSIARAIVHAPDVLLCDEPYSGLDEVGSLALTEALSERRAAGAAMLLVTHNLAEGLALASHACIMRRGKIVRLEERAAVSAASFATEYRELVTSDA